MKIYKEASKVTYQYQDASGAWQTVELNLSSFNIKTNFACPSVSEYTGTAKLPVSLVLANGKQYTFTYEDTPGWAGYKSGRLKRVTFPTGGYYEYSYPTTGNKGISCPSWSGGDGRTTSLTRVINDGVSSSTWQYSATMSGTYPNHFWTTTVTAPTLPYDSVGNQSSYTFGSQGNSRTETHYQGSSSALRTIQTTFTPDANWVKRPTTIVTILENDQQSKVENTFDLFGNVTEVREYDWGTGAPGTSVIRKATTSYLSTSAYTQRNILNRPTQVKVMDGTGVVLQQTDILYDETTPIATSGAVQHDYTNYGTSFNYRGNPTSVKQLVSGSTFLTTTNTTTIWGTCARPPIPAVTRPIFLTPIIFPMV